MKQFARPGCCRFSFPALRRPLWQKPAVNRPNWAKTNFAVSVVLAPGFSSVLDAPAGWLLNVAFSFAANTARGLVPPEAGRPVGRDCVHFADWQASIDGHELLDPILAQYRETIVVLEPV